MTSKVFFPLALKSNRNLYPQSRINNQYHYITLHKFRHHRICRFNTSFSYFGFYSVNQFLGVWDSWSTFYHWSNFNRLYFQIDEQSRKDQVKFTSAILYHSTITFRFNIGDNDKNVRVEDIRLRPCWIDLLAFVWKLPHSQSLGGSFFMSKCTLIYMTNDLDSRVV